jgi:hypothetical protein
MKINNIINSKKYKYFLTLFIFSLIIYGAFSTSTPDSITYIEIFIGLSLLLFVGLDGLTLLLKPNNINDPKFILLPGLVKLSFLYLLFVPTFNGILIEDVSIKNWLRDIIPLLYLFIPILLIQKINVIPKSLFLATIFSLCIIGILFSFRFYIGATGGISDIGKFQVITNNKDNIMSDPGPQFLLSFASCFSIWLLLRGRIIYGAIIFFISTIPWSITFAVISRGPAFFTFISVIIIIFYWLLTSKDRKNGFFLLILTPLLLITYAQESIEIIKDSLDLLILKNEVSGFNTRDLEVDVVLISLNKSVASFFFGHGWGSLIEIPNYWTLRNLHNIFLFYIYKTGILGLFSILVYFVWILRFIFLIGFQNKFLTIVMISLINPLLYTSLLQPMYKSLTFGILILLIPLMYKLRKSDEFDKYI